MRRPLLIAKVIRLLNAAQPLALLDRVGEGIFALDSDWRFSYLNRHAERVLARLSGTPSADLLGTVIWDRPSLADSSLGRALHRAHAEQVAVVHEVLDSGDRGSIEVRAYPSDDGLTVLLRESALQGHTAQILDGMGEAFLGCDHEWHITHVNERADRILSPLGFGRSRLLGLNVWRAFPALAGTRIQAEAFRAHAQGSEVELEEYLQPLGRTFPSGSPPHPAGWSATRGSLRRSRGSRSRSCRLVRNGSGAWWNRSTTSSSAWIGTSVAWTPSAAGWSAKGSRRPV